MITTLPTAAPTFHALTGTQPVGQTQVAVMTEYAGAITTITRRNDTYWIVATRDARNAFRGPWNACGMTAQIWMDAATMEFVVDYWDASFPGQAIEADRTRTLKAAVGVAADLTAQRWLTAQMRVR